VSGGLSLLAMSEHFAKALLMEVANRYPTCSELGSRVENLWCRSLLLHWTTV
jgi:hypothetical protein